MNTPAPPPYELLGRNTPVRVTVLHPRMYGRTNAAQAAADQLAADGHHVHYVASGETRCHTGHCTPKDTL